MSKVHTGVVLLNVGTPDEPNTAAVRRYLREFLGDERVIDMPTPLRWLLVNAIIAPFRSPKSAKAYQKIWSAEGSPLRTHGVQLASRIEANLGPGYAVRLGMRYGNPSLKEAMKAFQDMDVERIVAFPLYPQYASSSTGTSLAAVYEHAASHWNVMPITAVPAFYDDDGFIDAFIDVGQPVVDEESPEYVLFSFHGLPERHVQKSDLTKGHCLKQDDCCATITAANRHCYRAQCHATATKLAARLGLEDGQWSMSFQSRLGSNSVTNPWLKPYTDHTIEQLAKDGVKRLVVFCPAFVADCLETLEEIGIGLKEDFEEAGGEKLTLVPSLNSNASWADAATALIRKTLGQATAVAPSVPATAP